MVKKNYVIIQEINKELEKHRNFIGYVDGRLNAFDGDLLVIKTRYEKTKKEYNENTKDLQNARSDTLNKIKILEVKLKNVGKKQITKPEPKKKIIEKVKEIIKLPKSEPKPEPIPKIEEPPIEKVLEEKSNIADKMRDIADDINGEALIIAYVCQKGWNDEFENLFPKKAIWQGQITQGFAEWLKESKNYG